MAHLRSSAWLLSEASFHIAQSEANVFAQSDNWYSTQSFLGAYPRLREIEVLSQLARGHEVGGELVYSLVRSRSPWSRLTIAKQGPAADRNLIERDRRPTRQR